MWITRLYWVFDGMNASSFNGLNTATSWSNYEGDQWVRLFSFELYNIRRLMESYVTKERMFLTLALLLDL